MEPQRPPSPMEPKTACGQYFVREGLINPSDIHRVLSLQSNAGPAHTKASRRLFGAILCHLNLITPLDNYLCLARHDRLMTIDDWLIRNRCISRERMEKSRARSRQQGVPLTDLLVETGQVSVNQVRNCLFNLYHIPFRSLSDFRFTPSTIETLSGLSSASESRQHEAIPLAIRGTALVIGVTRPESLVLAGQKAIENPHYRLCPLFIPFKRFNTLFSQLYQEPFSGHRAEPEAHGVPETPESSQPLHAAKPIDLSLLFSFRTTISDPVSEAGAVLSLYKRYEVLREMTGGKKRRELSPEFIRFIDEKHKRIIKDYNCRAVDYFIRQEPSGVSIVAAPSTADISTKEQGRS